MCQKWSKREQRNEGLLLLLLAGVLLLFSSFHGSGLPGCFARPLLADQENVHGRSYFALFPKHQHQTMVVTPVATPSPAPAPAVGDAIVQIDVSPNTSPTKHEPMSLLWVFLIGPAVFLLFVVVVGAAMIRLVVQRHKREDPIVWKKGISDSENDKLQKTTFAGVPVSSVLELEAACEEFTNVIGTSSECTVFKGIRPSDGLPIAVMRVNIPPSSWTASKEIEFRRKVEDLARMNHENLVNLLAYSTAEKPFERMLVFEYASNGTLYEHLHAKDSEEDHLDWPMRMRIVMGAAYGLQYMHHELNPPASHFRFDASHVFLTEDYAAKVADFGISPTSLDRKFLGRRKSFRRIVRAIGYPDWEGYRHTPYLESNIRSFGVFLLETITGRPPYVETQGPLIDWAKDYLSDPDKMWYLVDPSLKTYKKQELEDICEVVRLCIKPRASKLPTMRDVTEMLSKALHLSQEAANRKGSPLLWAEMELLASMDSSSDDPETLMNSPRHRRLGSQGSSKCSTQPQWAASDLHCPGQKVSNGAEGDTTDHEATITMSAVSPRPNLSRGGSNKSFNRLWAGNVSELELLSPLELDREAGSSEENPETPLARAAAALSSSSSLTVSQTSLGKNFRHVWAGTSTELSKLELLPTRGISSDPGLLGR